MAGYIGSKTSVTQVDGYNRTEADDEFVNDPNSVISVSGSNVGIGTTSPSSALHVDSSNDGPIFDSGGTGNTNHALLVRDSGNNQLLRVNNNGNVGIGTSSPNVNLEVAGSSAQVFFNNTDATGNGSHDFSVTALKPGTGFNNLNIGGYETRFKVGGSQTEAARIDSSGNLLVGTTTTLPHSSNVEGVTIPSGSYGGFISASRSSNACMALNRMTNDGEILSFRQDGVGVGSIGSVSYGMQIYATGANNTGWTFGDGSAVLPMKNSALSDNFVDLGSASYRMDDIYATNGTIQTSDRNEKQDIEALSDAEQRVAVACKGLLRKFRWKDAVAEKGDDARIHFGIIAQDLQDAFAAEGLDAGRYAMFISSTWWETQTEVSAVEAVEAVEATYDEDGNELTAAVEAVEAKEAYTRTDTYETLEEAPAGATERTRLGVRYPELLAFIIGAM